MAFWEGLAGGFGAPAPRSRRGRPFPSATPSSTPTASSPRRGRPERPDARSQSDGGTANDTPQGDIHRDSIPAGALSLFSPKPSSVLHQFVVGIRSSDPPDLRMAKQSAKPPLDMVNPDDMQEQDGQHLLLPSCVAFMKNLSRRRKRLCLAETLHHLGCPVVKVLCRIHSFPPVSPVDCHPQPARRITPCAAPPHGDAFGGIRR